MNCPKCGQNIGGFKFCPFCGADADQKVPQQSDVPPPTQQPTYQPPQPHAPPSPVPPAPTPYVPYQTTPPKKKDGCLKVGLIVLAVIAVFIALITIMALSTGGNDDTGGSVLASTSSSAEPNETSVEAPEPEAPIKITAADLWKAYSDNKVNADNLYKGKTLAVTGTISDISQDMLSKDPCVSLDTDVQFGLYPIQCFFYDDGEGNVDIAALKDDQEITIIGKCKGTPILQVQLTDCQLSKSE